MSNKSGKRRARGTGSIFWSESRQLWVGRVPVGKSAAGYTAYREVSGKTQSEVVAKLKALAPPAPTITVAEWGKRWVETLSVRSQTRESYVNSLTTRILPSLGHLRVTAVTPHQVEHTIRDWRKALSANTARLTASHLRIMFNAAVRAELLIRNPVSIARKPRAEKTEVVTFTAVELARIIARSPPVIALVASTGMRKGEALALNVTDFDRLAGTVAITKTTTHAGSQVGPPKSPHSVRTIRVPGAALPAVVAAVGKRTAGPLFPGQRGRLSDGGFDWLWRNALAQLKLPYRNPHTLRHSVASVLIANGVGLADVAAFLGDSPETVARTYLHASGIDPAKTLDEVFGEQPIKRRRPL